MWTAIDPHPYVHGWHIDAICEHMSATLTGDIRRLLINIPPRHMKSLGISVGFPAWAWIKKPALQFLFASYAHSLSIRDGVKCRRIIDSPLYQERWGNLVRLTSDQNTKVRFDNDKGGYRIATSVDGTATGEGGDYIIIDDANNVREAESETTRTATNNWFDEAMQSRFNDPKTGVLVSIQQRTHYLDLSGHIMRKYGDEYTYLILPAEYELESKRKMSLRTFHGWKGDPRKEEGELLWPERFGRPEINVLKQALGTYASAGQLQQRPSPREGGIIPMLSFKRWKVAPDRKSWKRISLVFDTASKENELNDYSVCEVWVETATGYYLIYMWRKKCAFPELKRQAKNLCQIWRPHEILIEDKSSGIALIACLKEETKFNIIGIDPGSFSKTVRMENESIAIEAGTVWIPEDATCYVEIPEGKLHANWIQPFEEECMQFPMGEHDDTIDPMSMYLKRVRERRQRGPTIASPHFADLTKTNIFRSV
jgi:predicted phage terminase large subunit-like protein